VSKILAEIFIMVRIKESGDRDDVFYAQYTNRINCIEILLVILLY